MLSVSAQTTLTVLMLLSVSSQTTDIKMKNFIFIPIFAVLKNIKQFSRMTKDRFNDLKAKVEALRRYL